MKGDILKKYQDICEPPENANKLWFQNRGRLFELILKELLTYESLNPKIRIRPDGEEVDGSFIFGEKVYLCEAKWHKDELPASTIYQFKGKVDGKLVGTIGIFISLSGYSSDAVDALTLGKSVNVILFDKDDFEACLEEEDGFRKVLSTKLRYAAEEGNVYFPYKSQTIKLDISEEIITTKPQILNYQAISEKIVTENVISEINSDIILLCEGVRDKEILIRLSSRIMERYNIHKRISITVASGKYSMPKVLQSLNSLMVANTKVAIIVDSDGDIGNTLLFITSQTGLDFQHIVITHPSIEVWLINLSEDIPSNKVHEILHKNARQLGLKLQDYIKQLVDSIDIDSLVVSDEGFRKFVNIITT